MNKALLDELMQLSPAEQLWDSVHPPGSTRPGESFVLTEKISELDRRIEEHERHPERAESWEAVRARLWARFDK